MWIPVIPFNDYKENTCSLSLIHKLSLCGPIRLELNFLDTIFDENDSLPLWLNPLLDQYSIFVGPIPIDYSSNTLKTIDIIQKFLNNGAKIVLLEGTVEKIVDLVQQLPPERLAAKISLSEQTNLAKDKIQSLMQCVQYVLIDIEFFSNENNIQDIVTKCTALFGKGRFSFNLNKPNNEDSFDWNSLVGKLHVLNGRDFPINIEATQVPISQKNLETSNKFNFCIAESLIACLQTDRSDGLFATVISDEFAVVLGFAYSSKESIRSAIHSGCGVYWSRKRNCIWKKGATSGQVQQLVSVKMDCDSDALLFQVRQHGNPPVFCHLGNRSCFKISNSLFDLARVINEYKMKPAPNSYTTRLLNDQVLLQNKILEEAQEVVEAIDEQNSDHLAEEIADLIYFLLTCCTNSNVSFEKVMHILKRRSFKISRRSGNAKKARIEAAKALSELLKPPKTANTV